MLTAGQARIRITATPGGWVGHCTGCDARLAAELMPVEAAETAYGHARICMTPPHP